MADIVMFELNRSIDSILNKKIWSKHEYNLYSLLWDKIRKFRIHAKLFSKKGELDDFVSKLRRIDWFQTCKLGGLMTGIIENSFIHRMDGLSNSILLMCEYELAFIVQVIDTQIEVYYQSFRFDDHPVLYGDKYMIFCNSGTFNIHGVKLALSLTNDAWLNVKNVHFMLFTYELLHLFDKDNYISTLDIFANGTSIKDIVEKQKMTICGL